MKNLDWPTLLVELVLIFVGITAALWFENRNEDRRDRALEDEIRAELVEALRSDTVDLRSNLRLDSIGIAAIDSILRFMEDGRPYDPSMDTVFGASTQLSGFIQNTAAYEYLKSVGLGILSNDTERRAVVEYYEYDVRYLLRIEEKFSMDNWQNALKPLMLREFQYRLFGQEAKPNDYSELMADPQYRSVLQTTREILVWKRQLSDVVLEGARDILDLLRSTR